MPDVRLRRTVVLIDGFNLYHGLRASTGRRHLWLDMQRLSESLLKPDQVLVGVRYFTAMVRDDPEGHQRQDVYLQALARHCDRLQINLGRFQQRRLRCPTCGAGHLAYEEKESDVALAAHLLEIAAARTADVAILISGDADFVPAFASARRVNPDLRLVAVFPPKRISDALKAASDAWLNLGQGRVRKSLLPPMVIGENGPLLRPESWNLGGLDSRWELRWRRKPHRRRRLCPTPMTLRNTAGGCCNCPTGSCATAWMSSSTSGTRNSGPTSCISWSAG